MFHSAHGTTTTTSRASAWPSSAPARARSSSCPRSRRRGAADGLPALGAVGARRRWTAPTASAWATARARAGAAEALAPRLVGLDRVARAGVHAARAGRRGCNAVGARCRSSSASSSCAATAGCGGDHDRQPNRLQAPADHLGLVPTLRRDNVDLVTDAIARGSRGRVVAEDGTDHPADTIIFGTGFPPPSSSPRWRWRARGAQLQERGRTAPRPTSADRPRLPEHVPALRAEHQPRHRLGDRNDRGSGEVRGGRWRTVTKGAAERIEVRAEVHDAFARELLSDWTTACGRRARTGT